MAISSKNKIYGGVLSVGLIALVADKVFLAPADAAAIDPVVAEYSATEQDSVLASARSELGLEAPVATADASNMIIEQLSRIAQAQDLDLDNIHDAFKPSRAWQTTSEVIAVKTTTLADGAGSRFLKNHRLLAVMGNGNSASVIINDKCLFIGQIIDGFTLVSVGDRVAKLDFDGLIVKLELPGSNISPTEND